MSKGDSNSKPVGCKLWDCSLNLKIRDNVDIILDSDNCSLLQDLINNTGVTRFIGDCFECYQMRGFDIRSIMPSAWKDLYMQFLNRVRSFVDTVTDVGPQVSSVL